MKKTAEQRFWVKVGPHDDPTKCWLWLAATIKSNHGEAMKIAAKCKQIMTKWGLVWVHICRK